MKCTAINQPRPTTFMLFSSSCHSGLATARLAPPARGPAQPCFSLPKEKTAEPVCPTHLQGLFKDRNLDGMACLPSTQQRQVQKAAWQAAVAVCKDADRCLHGTDVAGISFSKLLVFQKGEFSAGAVQAQWAGSRSWDALPQQTQSKH